ncbi:MAG: putative acetyltransferase [Myxococcota bacterium]|jgi:putative acetyltransferase
MQPMGILVRPLHREDEDTVRAIVLLAQEEHDPSASHPAPATFLDAFDTPGSEYLVVEVDGALVGGGGFAALPGSSGTADVQSLYLARESRGRGLGRALLEAVVRAAHAAGYTTLYTELAPDMAAAQRLLWAGGFLPRSDRLGDTGRDDYSVFLELAIS